ncbi:hypothetical protein QUF74_09750 [Candidatus Halobeggiatoa sp. HSG11]|nr:hypothetical protein [Candidatus Halobeggiatoa sp. HSG11]
MRTLGLLLGLLLFLVGIISALITAAKLPIINTNWSDMLLLYSISIFFACIGLLIYYKFQSLQSITDNSSCVLCSNIAEQLQKLISELNKLETEIFTLEAVEITNRINILLNNYVLPCSAARQEITELLGHYQGSEVLISIANGERLLNRICSAASDEKIQEIYIIYPKVLFHFEEAYCKCIHYQTCLLNSQQKC